jgi:hypothetical protein
MDVVFLFQQTNEVEEDIGEHLRVIDRPVMVELA